MRALLLLCVIALMLLPTFISKASSGRSVPVRYAKKWSQESIVRKVVQVAEKHDVEPAVALAIVEIESNFNPRAIKWEKHLNTASVGLFQVLHKTAQLQFGFKGGIESLMKPVDNIKIGVSYIKQCSASTLEDLACCYQAGHAAKKSFCAKHSGVRNYAKLLKEKASEWDKRLN